MVSYFFKLNDEQMNKLTVRNFENKFFLAGNLFKWIYGGEQLKLESPNDDLTKLMNQIKFEVL